MIYIVNTTQFSYSAGARISELVVAGKFNSKQTQAQPVKAYCIKKQVNAGERWVDF